MFYDVYAELCRKTGERPYAVAALAGAKSNSSVAQWQKGSVPRRQVLQNIADHFGVSIDYLLTGKEKSQETEAQEFYEYLEDLKNRSEMRMLFKLAKNASKEEVEQTVRIIEAIRNKP